ncbi:MAG: hypothetical protein ACOZAR_03175 [Patescibacteria group bacterium]
MSKKKKKLKSHIFHATHQAKHQAATGNTDGRGSEANTSANVTYFSAAPEDKSHKYDRQFGHVLPDLKFFGVMVVMMAIVLGVIYYFDQTGNLIIKVGDQVYKILNLS